jgi:transcription elongation factor GreA
LKLTPFEGLISNESPLAKAMMGRLVGDGIEIKDVANPYRIEIINVK